MSLLEHRPDTCRTAADVIAAVAGARSWRQKMFGRPQKKIAVTKPVEIEPAPPPEIPTAALGEVTIFDPIIPNFAFDGEGFNLFKSRDAVAAELKILEESLSQLYSLRQIIGAVARAFDIGSDDIISSRRRASVMGARHVTYALCRRLTLHSLPQIGCVLGHRDHTTIMHGVRKMEPLIAAIELKIEPGASLARWAELARELYPVVFPKGGA